MPTRLVRDPSAPLAECYVLLTDCPTASLPTRGSRHRRRGKAHFDHENQETTPARLHRMDSAASETWVAPQRWGGSLGNSPLVPCAPQEKKITTAPRAAAQRTT